MKTSDNSKIKTQHTCYISSLLVISSFTYMQTPDL